MNVETFNRLHPVGTLVLAYPACRPEDCPSDPRLVTRTRSKAEVLGGHTDVVWVDDYSSCIALDHVDVVSEAEWEAAKQADAVAEQGSLPVPVTTPVAALYVQGQTDAWIPPLDMARGLAQEDLAIQQKANIHDREAMVRAATTLEIRLRQVLAALDATDAELDAVRAERDAFRDQRNEVFKTNERLIAEALKSDQAQLRAENDTRTAKRELSVVAAERDALQQRLHEAALAKVWVNEDGKRFVFAEDIAPALYGIKPTEAAS